MAKFWIESKDTPGYYDGPNGWLVILGRNGRIKYYDVYRPHRRPSLKSLVARCSTLKVAQEIVENIEQA